jgi:uncharacterized protein YoxC
MSYDGFGYTDGLPSNKEYFKPVTRQATQMDLFYEDIESIRRWAYRIWATLMIIAVGFAIMIVCAVVVASVIFLHRSTLQSIEKKTDDILEQVEMFINASYELTRDLDNNYQIARDRHLEHLKSLGEEGGILAANWEEGDDSANNLPDYLNNVKNETYAQHFMNILLHVLPLHDDAAMVQKITNTLNAWDAAMSMIQQANLTGIVGNTSMLEYHVNQIMESDATKRVAEKGAEFVSSAMDRREEIVNEYFVAKRQLGTTLGRADELSRTPLVDNVIHNRKTIAGIGHLGKNVDEVMNALIAFGHTNEAKDIAGNVVDIIGATNHFHALKYAAEVLKLVSDVGARTAGIDIQKEMNMDNGEHFAKDAKGEAEKWME